MYSVEFDDAAVQRAFQRLASGMDDMSRPMNEIGGALVVSAKDRITEGVSPDGTPFAPRSATTIAAYEKRKQSYGGVLRMSGDMQSDLFHQYGPTSVEYGSNAIQSAVMQFGAAQGQFGAHIGKDKLGRDHFHSIPWGNIPARPFIGLSAEDSDMILETLEDWIADLSGQPD